MSNSWPQAALGEVLTKSEEWTDINPTDTYNEITVRLWGKGVTLRREVEGSEIASGRRLVARAGQFILSRIDARNGALGLVPDSLDGAVASNDFPLFTPNPSRLLPAFLDWMSKTRSFVEICKAASEGTTNRVRLQEDRFLRMTISLPSVPEQRRIVARIEELAAKIKEARSLRQQATQEGEALVGAKAAGIFHAALKNGSQPLESVATLERGKFSYRPRNDPRFFGGSHPWIQIGEIEQSNKFIRNWTQTLNDEGLAISKMFPRGTVLISIAATIGAVGILDFDCCVPDSIVGVTPHAGTDSEFIYHYLGYLRGHLEDIAPQSAQKNINLQILSALPVPQLGLIEQRRIVAELDALQAQVDALEKLQAESATELGALLPSILDKAFKGEF